MRILVHGLAGDKLGGIETFVLNMEKFMSDDIIFDYVLESNPESNQYVFGKGENFFITPKRKLFQNLKDWSRLLKERKDFDKAVYFNMYSLAWLFPVILARLYGYRVIVHAHNNNLHDCGLLQRLVHIINRQVQKCMKITRLTNSGLSAKFFFGKKPAVMVYNAIDTERFSFNSETRAEMRKSLGLEGKHVYGFSGRIAYQKNPLFLMDVFAEIAKKDGDAAFLVCGDGDLMKKTREKADKLGISVFFVGSVRKVEDYYQAMDCFVLPSRFEGLGIVLIEAQCSGLPCITSSGVVPRDAKVTELLEFISLNDTAEKWAELAAYKCQKQDDRLKYKKIIASGRFNIQKEAKLLEEILLSC